MEQHVPAATIATVACLFIAFLCTAVIAPAVVSLALAIGAAATWCVWLDGPGPALETGPDVNAADETARS
jgi:hypothetical protein